MLTCAENLFSLQECEACITSEGDEVQYRPVIQGSHSSKQNISQMTNFFPAIR